MGACYSLLGSDANGTDGPGNAARTAAKSAPVRPPNRDIDDTPGPAGAKHLTHPRRVEKRTCEAVFAARKVDFPVISGRT